MRYRFVPMLMVLLMTLLPALVTAQTSVASPVATPSGWQVTESREIDVDGQPVALSPDGRWIVGVGPNGTGICVWVVETLAPSCAGENIRPERRSITWAPDSSAVAFTDGSIIEPEPNTLWLFSVTNASVTAGAGQAIDNAGTTVYAAPTWTPDSQRVVFLRMPMALVDDSAVTGVRGSTIVLINADGGELTTVPLPATNYSARIVPMPDGRLLFYVLAEPGAGFAGIWRARLDGSGLEQIVSADALTGMVLVQLGTLSPDQQTLLVWGIESPPGDGGVMPVPFLLDLATGVFEPLPVADGSRTLWAAFPLATGASIAAVMTYDNATSTVSLQMLDVASEESQPVKGGEFALWKGDWFVSWAENGHVLIATDTVTVLLTIEPGA